MSKERFKCYYCAGIENILVEDTINNETYIEDNIVNLLNQQDKQIKELEQQLNKDFTLREYIRLEQENAKLKQQLADKDKEIENAQNLKAIEVADELSLKLSKIHNQDKISFAVEVLKIAQDYVQQYVNNFDDMNDCLCAIDNQIKRLTHQHEDKGE